LPAGSFDGVDGLTKGNATGSGSTPIKISNKTIVHNNAPVDVSTEERGSGMNGRSSCSSIGVSNGSRTTRISDYGILGAGRAWQGLK
jgi:hypothetical protein